MRGRVLRQIASAGGAKAELSVGKTIILSLLAGVYISLGALTMLSVGGATPGLASVSHLTKYRTCFAFTHLVRSVLWISFPHQCIVELEVRVLHGERGLILFSAAAVLGSKVVLWCSRLATVWRRLLQVNMGQVDWIDIVAVEVGMQASNSQVNGRQ